MKKNTILFILIITIFTGCLRNDAITEQPDQTTITTFEQLVQTTEPQKIVATPNATLDSQMFLEEPVSESQSDENTDNAASEIKEPDYARIYYDFVCMAYTEYLFEADLADLDGDGKPELVVIIEKPGGNPDYGYYSDLLIEIYKFTDGSVILLDSVSSEEERWSDFRQGKSGEIYLTSYNKKDYICFDCYSSHQGGGSVTSIFLALDDRYKLSVEFSYGNNTYEAKYFGEEFNYEDLGLPEYTSVLWYGYIEEYGFYYLRLADYWINDRDTNVFEYEYEELADGIESHMDIWHCGWDWNEKSTYNFSNGERLRDCLE